MPPDAASSTSLNILKLPPFYTVDQVANLREIGGYFSTKTDGTGNPLIVRKTHIFRSAELTYITPQGADTMKGLGIRKIFDLRADVEVKHTGVAPAVLQNAGIDVQRVGIAEEWPDAETLGKKLDRYATDTVAAFTENCVTILRKFPKSFAIIFRHIKDHPADGCLIHCTAGKDRTGIFSALLLSLLDVSDEDIAKDYSLTTAGLAPFIPILAARFADQPVFKDHWEGTLKMGSSEPEVMIAVLAEIRKLYGSAEGYLLSEAGLTREELEEVKKTMLIPSSP